MQYFYLHNGYTHFTKWLSAAPGSLTALSEIEKLDNFPHWLATNEPAETNRALHLLLESITVSVETIELKFK